MKIKFTKISLALTAMTLAVFTVNGIKTESGENGAREQKEQKESESAAGYIKWRQQRLVNQVTGEVNLQDVIDANKQAAALEGLNKTNAAMTWTEVGPDNVGGRTRSILVDRNNNKIVYAGSVSGGIWRSTTGGSSWTRVNDQMASLSICSMTQAANGDIYVGTGEDAFVSVFGSTNASPGFAGAGVFKSTDGINFTLLPTASATSQAFWANTSDIMADPTNANKIYAGNTGGLYVTNDAGSTWAKAPGAAAGSCIDIDISSDGQVVAAVIGTSIYLSTDGGANFAKSNITVWGGTPKRISISVAPTNSSYIYAMASSQATDRLLSVIRTTDKGANWSSIIIGTVPYSDILGSSIQGQGYWDNVTSVDPDNENHVYLGGIDLWDWTPAVGLKPISVWYYPRTSPLFVHADNHVIIWDKKTSPATMYIGNDGGVFKSYDKGKNFFASNKGYNVTQFYAVAAAFDQNKNSWVVGGGAQDNGTWLVDGMGNTALSGVDVNGGDGFYCELSQKIPGFGIYSTYDSDLESARNYIRRDNDPAKKYDQTLYTDQMSAFCKDSGQFNTPFRLWETTTSDSISELIMGARGATWIARDIYKDMTKVPLWFRLTNINGSASTIDISNDGNTALIGLINGLVYRVDGIRTTGVYDTTNLRVNSLSVTQIFSTGGRAVNSVNFSKTNKNKAVITLGNYGNADYVFFTTDLMVPTPTFNSIHGNLPRFPVYDAQINMDDSTVLILGTEKGIYVSHNFLSGSPIYTFENSGMANVPVFMVRQYRNPSPWYKFEGPHFFIGTHGRGFFSSNTFARVGLTNNNKGNDRSLISIYPNPASTETTISFNCMKQGKANVIIYNLQGQAILHEEISTTSGRNNYGFYVNELSAGNYIAVVEHDGTKESKKLVVVR